MSSKVQKSLQQGIKLTRLYGKTNFVVTGNPSENELTASDCWRALERQHTILCKVYKSGKKSKICRM